MAARTLGRPVGARGAAIEHRTRESGGGAIDRVLVAEVPVRFARDEATTLAATGAGRRATRVSRSFAHRDLLSVSVAVGLTARAGGAEGPPDLPFVARKNRLVAVAPGRRDVPRAADRIDARVRREAACLPDFRALRSEKSAVDEGALARIVVRANEEVLSFAPGHRAGVGSTVRGGPFVARRMDTGADGVARRRLRQAPRGGPSRVARKPGVDACRGIAKVRGVVRVSAACDAGAPLRDLGEAKRGRCDGRVFERRRGTRSRAARGGRGDPRERGERRPGASHTAICLLNFSSELTSSCAAERFASSIASRK